MAITRIWQSGFESGFLDYTGAIGSNSPTIFSTISYTGTYCLQCNHIDTAGQGFYITIPATRQVRLGAFIRKGNVNRTSDSINGAYPIELRDVSGNILTRVYMGGYVTGEEDCMRLYVGGTLQDTELGAAPGQVWMHIGVDVKIDSSAGWVKVYKDGMEILSYSGNTGNTDIVNFRSYGAVANGPTFWYDDFYIDDTTGESSAAALPLKRFRYLTLDGNGNYNGNWTGSDGNSTDNYQLIDEVPASATDYIQETVVDQLESFTCTTYTLGTNETIDAVIPVAIAKKNGLTEQLAVGTRYSSTDAIGSDQSPASSYSPIAERQTTKPGGGAWDQSALDDFEVVIKSRGSY